MPEPTVTMTVGAGDMLALQNLLTSRVEDCEMQLDALTNVGDLAPHSRAYWEDQLGYAKRLLDAAKAAME